MNDRRSIQDIVPPARSKPIRRSTQSEPQQNGHTPLPPKPSKKGRTREKERSFLGLIGIALVVILIVGAAFGVVSTVFHRATVSIELHTFTIPIAQTFEASPGGVLLSFKEHSVEKTLTKNVEKTGSEFVNERASGTITVFNEHSTQSQRLITNTRFETQDGRIYRVKNPVVVPGYTTQDGKKTPGTIEVTVYADEPGEEYNSPEEDFTIPGLKGSAQFDNMYASSNGPLSGGFVGEQAIVSSAVREATVEELKAELDRTMRSLFLDSLADDEIVSLDTIQVDFVESPQRATDDGAVIAVTAIATGPVFEEEKLARAIATEGNVTYEGALSIENLQDLAVVIESGETEGDVLLTISGEAKLIGVYDQEQLIHDLSGKDQRSVGIVLSGYPAISDMSISVYPFWRGVLPESDSRIEVLIKDAEGGE